MAEKVIDQSKWSGAEQFQLFRTYDKPHYAVTSRLDVSRLIDVHKPNGVSVYRAALFAIGVGIHWVEELRMRFRGDQVILHDRVDLSMTVPAEDGTFSYGYVTFHPDFAQFDDLAKHAIDAAKSGTLAPNTGQRDDLAYLSCMPWLDYTSINNAVSGPDDCIPRVSWGKFVKEADGAWRMAMTLEVHHALVEGHKVGLFFQEVQHALDEL